MKVFNSRSPHRRCFVIAEVGLGHDGSLGLAHSFVDAVAQTGAAAIKFQTHFAHAESTRAEPWRVSFSVQDVSRYDYWRRTEFTPDQWRGLKAHADQVGLLFLSSPFSAYAVEVLEGIGIEAWKIPSGEVGSLSLLKLVARTERPVLLSSGMSDWSELDRAVAVVRDGSAEFAILQCTTEYPTTPESVGLNVLDELRDRYRCPVGLSDHSGTIFPGVAAATLGASLVEVHVTLSRDMFGPDVASSLTIVELRELVRGVDFVTRALGSPIDKNRAAAALEPVRSVFMKTLVASRHLRAGSVILDGDLVEKKAGGGVPAGRLTALLGRRLLRPLDEDESIRESDLD